MTRPVAKGWCPGAYRPMHSGDGLIVRIRPHFARLSAEQALGLSQVSQRFGNGTIDLTSRSNLQIRGILETDYDALMTELEALKLLDEAPEIEARRNILVAPDWTQADETYALTTALTRQLGALPALPTKFGFAVDTGNAPMLTAASADIRIERDLSGALLLRADGAALGRPVTGETAVETVLDLAHWFAQNTKGQSLRMAQLLKTHPLPTVWCQTAPAETRNTLVPGPHPLGYVLGAAFGQIDAGAFETLIRCSGATGVRLTPWRLFMLETTASGPWQGFINHPEAAALNVSACPGAPACGAATVETRDLAYALSKHTTRSVHISGCSKGCALPRKAEITLVGRAGKFDLVRNGCSWDQPERSDLSETDVLTIADEIYHAL
ncbi:MAG: cobalamin biosynthesis protein CobG [Paracoccaceae bacterium]|nr:cobalamin biosynthesis protein CobG [Paracoccaceae bacterium]